jgi:hypothetical protein
MTQPTSRAERTHQEIKNLEVKIHDLLGQEPQPSGSPEYTGWLQRIRDARTQRVSLWYELWLSLSPLDPEWARDAAWAAYRGYYELERLSR